MKGFVPTPDHLVDAMVEKLFASRWPRATDRLLDPGCGTGAFIHGVIRWCQRSGSPIPTIVGIDSDRELAATARRSFRGVDQVRIVAGEFLRSWSEQFDYIVGNPPYVPITGLTVDERTNYRARYQTARGRFDLYLLFFEQAINLLGQNGRMVFVTPEKFLYVQTAAPLRRILARTGTEEIELINESVFDGLVTYPTITTINGSAPARQTAVRLRDGSSRSVRLSSLGSSWLPLISGSDHEESGPTLADAFVRISCGVATGADSVYVVDDAELPAALRRFALPTLSGRRLSQTGQIATTHSMLMPYAHSGALLTEMELGPLRDYLALPERRDRLMRRTCVLRKPWYAFHENPPLGEILRPKIMCKDIGQRPWFVVDEKGDIVPRHSIYYLVPRDPEELHDLCNYLNSDTATAWLMANCQRAANGFVRLQSHVLKRMPVPSRFSNGAQLSCV